MEVAATQGLSRNSALRTTSACFSSELESLGTGDIARLAKVLSGKPDAPSSVTSLHVVKRASTRTGGPLTSTQASGMRHVACTCPHTYNLHKCLKKTQVI